MLTVQPFHSLIITTGGLILLRVTIEVLLDVGGRDIFSVRVVSFADIVPEPGACQLSSASYGT